MSPHIAPLKLAVVGAGPAGLALALQAARKLPLAEVTLFDARPLDRDVSADPRTLALALGSVQLLRQLGAWPADLAQPILQVHVSQAPPTFATGGQQAELRLSAAEQQVPMLGAVLSYGALVSTLQRLWQAQEAAQAQRLHSRFGLAVNQVRNLPGGGVEVDAGIAERFDLAVVAEGGVFSDQARKAVAHDYGQTAWVGTVALQGATPGLAVERFTRQGPLALLPLPPLSPMPASTAQTPDAPPGRQAAPRPLQRAAMVWCVPDADDPVAELSDAQRVAVLNTLLPAAAGQVVQVAALKRFGLGLNAERTLVDGAVVRIGNAAQTLHPVAGQGLNLGLRDAVVLVQALREASAGAGSGAAMGAATGAATAATPSATNGAETPWAARLPPLLRRLEWQRGPDRWAMIAATDFLARSFTWRWPGLPALRGLGLAALQRSGPLKTALARQMMFGRR